MNKAYFPNESEDPLSFLNFVHSYIEQTYGEWHHQKKDRFQRCLAKLYWYTKPAYDGEDSIEAFLDWCRQYMRSQEFHELFERFLRRNYGLYKRELRSQPKPLIFPS